MTYREDADKVDLKVGMTIFWDDREGWRGRIEALNEDGTVVVSYDNGERDDKMPRHMLTVANTTWGNQ